MNYTDQYLLAVYTMSLCLIHTIGSMFHPQRFCLIAQPPPRTPHTFQDMVYHSHCRRYNLWLETFGEMPLSFNENPNLVCNHVTTEANCPFTSTHLMLQCYTKRLSSQNFMYTTDYTFCCKKFIHASVHAHSVKIRG